MPQTHAQTPHFARPPLWRDVAVFALVGAGTLAVSVYYDIFDRLIRWYLGRGGLMNVEEIVIVLLVLGFFFSLYAVMMWVRVGRAERFARMTLQALADFVIILDGDGNVISANFSHETAAGCPPLIVDALSTGSYFTCCGAGGAAGKTLAAAIRKVAAGATEKAVVEHTGEGCHFICTVTSFRIGDEIRVVVCHEDISELKRAEREVERLAFQDVLTGLPNRRLLTDRLRHSLAFAARASSRVGILFLDLDDFKNINDTLGHPVGDKLLKMVGKELAGRVRATDSVGRMGGDEFLVILPGVRSAADIADIAGNLLRILDRPFVLDGRTVYISASMGIAVFPDDGRTPEELLRNADLAMYRAKNDRGQGMAFFAAEMNTQARSRLELETSLRQAIEREEFVLHYQPRVDARTGEVTCLEALVRWNHPEAGLVPPGAFIPLAEETGLIVPLGEWVMAEALRHAKILLDEGHPPVKVSVNISGRQLRHDFHDRVVSTVAASGLPPSLIEIEITETALMANPSETAKTLKGLKDFGIGLSVDDFGTGYSSLNYLRRFPFDTVKIDRSFVRDLPADEESAAIVNAIIALGRTLNLRVVAEGAETEEQLRWLTGKNCDEIQGFCFSKPVPGTEVAPLLTRHRTALAAIRAAERPAAAVSLSGVPPSP